MGGNVLRLYWTGKIIVEFGIVWVVFFIQCISTVLDKSLLSDDPNSWVNPDLWIWNDLCMLSLSIWQVTLCILLGRSDGHKETMSHVYIDMCSLN